MAMTDIHTRRRVKLYILNEERQWDDRGTGHVSWGYVERFKGIALCVKSEVDGQYYFLFKFSIRACHCLFLERVT